MPGVACLDRVACRKWRPWAAGVCWLGLLLGSGLLGGEAPTYQWVQQLDRASANSVAVDRDGNWFVAGGFQQVATFGETNLTSHGYTDCFLAKLDPLGRLQWVRQVGTDDNDQVAKVVTDSWGNSYLLGRIATGTGDFSVRVQFGDAERISPHGSSSFIAKYDVQGELQWAQLTDLTTGSYSSPSGAAADADGTLWVVGQLPRTGFVRQYGGDGSLRWSREIAPAVSGGYSAAYAAALDRDGALVVAGASFGPFVSKYERTGAVAWVVQGLPGSITEILPDDLGNWYGLGTFEGIVQFGSTTLTSAGRQDLVLLKYDTAWSPQWALNMGGAGFDSPRALAVDPRGDVYCSGWFSESAQIGGPVPTALAPGPFVAQFNGAGLLQWVLTNAQATLLDVTADRSANCLVTGSATGPARLGGFALDNLASGTGWGFVARLGGDILPAYIVAQPLDQHIPEGGVLWLRVAPGGAPPSTCQWRLNGIPLSQATNTVLALAEADPSAAGEYDAVLCNSSGCATSAVARVEVLPFPRLPKFEWVQQVWRISPMNTSADSVVIRDVKGDAQGDCVVLGQSAGPTFFGTTRLDFLYPDFFVAKYDKSGVLRWIAKDTPKATTQFSVTRALAVDNLRNSFAAGYSLDLFEQYTDGFLAKYSASGSRQWLKQIGQPGRHETADRVVTDSAGNAYVLLWETSQAVIARFSPAGTRSDILSVSTTNGAFGVRDIGVDRDGNLFLFGSFSGSFGLGGTSLASRGQTDVFVAKFALTGALLWMQQGGGTGGEYAYQMAIDGAGEACILGTVSSGSPGTECIFGDATLRTKGSLDLFVVKYRTDGIVRWARQISGGFVTSSLDAYTLSADDVGNAFIAASFSGRAQVESITLTSRGASDALIAAYSAAGDLLWLRQAGGSADDRPTAIAADPLGAVYTAGVFLGAADFGTLHLSPRTDDPMTPNDVFLAKLTPQARMDIQKPSPGIGGGQFRLTLFSDYKVPYAIETSGNLLSWAPWWTGMNSSGTLSFTDPPTAGQTSRFYRARVGY